MERADRRRTIGSIPAHTGERETDSTDDRSTRVYPRTYGGTADNAVRRTGKPGLSPHIRGNESPLPRAPQSPGSIPAHTGERFATVLNRCRNRVYPRTYGGTQVVSAEHNVGKGSIPAHTGERFRNPTA